MKHILISLTPTLLIFLYVCVVLSNNMRNKIGASNTQFDFSFQPSSAIPADTTTDEHLLVLEFPYPLYDADLGASSTTFVGSRWSRGSKTKRVFISCIASYWTTGRSMD